MNKSVLTTRPEYEYTTRYISVWAERVVEFAKQKGFAVFDLAKQRATKQQVESMMEKHRPGLVFLNGHGNNSCVTGQDEEILVEAGLNEEILSDTITYALSCSSAQTLGQAAVEKGTRAYIGYSRDFALMFDDEKRTRPQDDKVADLFLTPSNQVMVSLLKGHTAQEAHESSVKYFKKNLRKLLTSTSTDKESATIPYLLWDMQSQVVVGDGLSKLEQN